jgi:arylsulfatase
LAGEFDGKSLFPLLKDADASWQDRMIFSHVGRWEGATADAHKYTFANVRWKKYNLVRNDACDDPKCKNKKCELITGRRKNSIYTSDSGFHFSGNTQGQWALFDFSNDKDESSDIASEHPDIVSKMSEAYEQWWTDVRPFIR